MDGRTELLVRNVAIMTENGHIFKQKKMSLGKKVSKFVSPSFEVISSKVAILTTKCPFWGM